MLFINNLLYLDRDRRPLTLHFLTFDRHYLELYREEVLEC